LGTSDSAAINFMGIKCFLNLNVPQTIPNKSGVVRSLEET
jgi:hypothetical protein